jgi:hypothetical protein
MQLRSLQAAASGQPYVLTPGVNDYNAQLMSAARNCASSDGQYSIAQCFALAGNSQQYWQEVQQAYNEGLNPTTTTFVDTWLTGISLVPAAPGSAQALSNLQDAQNSYLMALVDDGETQAQAQAQWNANVAPGINATPISSPAPAPAVAQNVAASAGPIVPVSAIVAPAPATPAPVSAPVASTIGTTSIPSVVAIPAPTPAPQPAMVNMTPAPSSYSGTTAAGTAEAPMATAPGMSDTVLFGIAAGLGLLYLLSKKD